MTDREAQKEAAGRMAAALVRDGQQVGLGTGSTIRYTILALGEAGLDITVTATSVATHELAESLGMHVVTPDEMGRLDIAIDGADEVDPDWNLTKGGGGAHTREKIVAEMADRFVVVADESKLVDHLGPFGTPLEVLDFAPDVVAERVRALGATEVIRRDDRSDNGNLLVDARFGTIEHPARIARELGSIPGVVEHGIFLAETVDLVIAAGPRGAREVPRR